MNDQPGRNGWTAYEKMVLQRLGRLDDDVKRVQDDVTALRVEVAMLKVKSGLWGAVAGLIPAVIIALIAYIGGGPSA